MVDRDVKAGTEVENHLSFIVKTFFLVLYDEFI